MSERQKVLGLRRCDNDFANGVFGETAKTNLQNPDKEMGISLQPSRIGQIKGNFWCPIDACVWTNFGSILGHIPLKCPLKCWQNAFMSAALFVLINVKPKVIKIDHH